MGAIIGGALIAAGGAYAASRSASKASQQAQDANTNNTLGTNALNERLFRIGRGSEGSAILPDYLKGQESLLGNQAANIAALGLNADPSNYSAAIDTVRPGIAGSNAAVNDLFTGATLNNRLGSLQPVATARTSLAKTRLAQIDQSLNETIGRLNAASASRGFLGGGSFDQQQLLGATLGARQAGATEVGGVNLQNAQDEASIRDADTLMRIQQAQLPFQQAQRQVDLQSLPAVSAAQQAQAALAPLNFFRIGNQSFQAQPLPSQQPIIGATGNLGAAVGAAGQSIGNYYAQQQYANALRAQQQPTIGQLYPNAGAYQDPYYSPPEG